MTMSSVAKYWNAIHIIAEELKEEVIIQDDGSFCVENENVCV